MADSEDMVERVARILEPQAWEALDKPGSAASIAYANRRTSSLRKARAAIAAMVDLNETMAGKMATMAYEWGVDSDCAAKCAEEIWYTGIDAALQQPGTVGRGG